MREMLTRHFDVIVAVWVLALAVGWSMLALSRASLSNDQWSSSPPGPAWVVPSPVASALPSLFNLCSLGYPGQAVEKALSGEQAN